MRAKGSVRVQYYWVPESKIVDMPIKPTSVQTVISKDPQDPDYTPRLGIIDEEPHRLAPAHHQQVFYEDFIHDWNWKDGKLRYYSRFESHSVWIRCEFEEEAKSDNPYER